MSEPTERPFRPRRRGFTLIELLVVISIIALLIGILLPALGAARATARDVQCLSNIRQVSIGAYAYSADNKAFVIQAAAKTAGSTNANDPFSDVDAYWTSTLITGGYGLTREFFECPSFSGRELNDPVFILNADLDDPAQVNYTNVDYAINGRVATRRDGFRVSGFSGAKVFDAFALEDFNGSQRIEDALNPSETYLAMDSFFIAGDPASPTYNPSIRNRGTFVLYGNDTSSGSPGESVHGRHGNQSVNFGYLDGHGDATPLDDIFDPYAPSGSVPSEVSGEIVPFQAEDDLWDLE